MSTCNCLKHSAIMIYHNLRNVNTMYADYMVVQYIQMAEVSISISLLLLKYQITRFQTTHRGPFGKLCFDKNCLFFRDINRGRFGKYCHFMLSCMIKWKFDWLICRIQNGILLMVYY